MVWLAKDRTYLTADGIRVTKKRCKFFHSCKSLFVIPELLFNTKTNLTTIEIGDLKHTHHNVVKDGIRKRFHKYYQSVIIVTSPNKLNMKPAHDNAEAKAKGIPVGEKLKKRMKRQLTRLRNKSVGLINGWANK